MTMLILALAVQSAQPVEAVSMLPAPVRAMIDAALAKGDAKVIEGVLQLARQTNPDAADEIGAMEADYRTKAAVERERAERERIARLTGAGLFDNWKGQVELGASRSTGNSNNLGLYGSLGLNREGLQWRHKIDARADIQETNGVTTTERVLAGWQPNFKFDDRLYAFGLTQYEHDRFLGYNSRYTLAGGAGYGVIASEKVKLDVEGGPAFRHTDAVGEGGGSTLAGRASLALKWKITPTLQFNQTGALYLEQGDSSASAATALDTKLIGALKARFSYNIQYERDAPPGVKAVDTLSRATLVYSF